jgi:hypothetical protein
MQPKMLCQSCTMPIDNVTDRGTEKDGSYNNEYCKYCYGDGAFLNPELTLDQMKSRITKQMKKRNLPYEILQQSLTMVSNLKRWEKNKRRK